MSESLQERRVGLYHHHRHVRLFKKTMTNRIVTTGKTMNEKLKLINSFL